MSTDFYLAALEYHRLGYMTMPLTMDAQGFPKRPMVPNWSALPYSLEALKKLPWEQAAGLGIVLGPASKNLAVIDLDDVRLAEAAAKWTHHTRTVRTIRGRGHVYVREATPSKSRSLVIQWKDQTIKVELKAAGTQVAAPPTPGYSFWAEAEPKAVTSIGQAWAGLARCLGIEPGENGEHYPKPWRDKVLAGDRNKSAYVEAHMLREAGMVLPLALRFMQLRWESDYEKGDVRWEEIARTVESAYAKGSIIPLYHELTDWS